MGVISSRQTEILRYVRKHRHEPNANRLVHYPAYRAYYACIPLRLNPLRISGQRLHYPSTGTFPLEFLTSEGREVFDTACRFAQPEGKKVGGKPRFKGVSQTTLYLKWETSKVDLAGLNAFYDWLQEKGYAVRREDMITVRHTDPDVHYVKFTIS